MLTESSMFTGKIVEMALDGLSLRHFAITQNIANSQTQGYRPINVSFERQISALLATFKSSNIKQYKLTPEIQYGPSQLGVTNSNELDKSIVLLNQNNIQYQALIKGLQKYGASISSAISEGRK